MTAAVYRGRVDPDAEAMPPEQAFQLLSDGTRVAILRELWAAPADAVPFSDLRGLVGSPDSGQFNYHLGELRGHLVSRTEAGYELTQSGREVVRAVLAGSITDRPVLEPAPIDGTCSSCGATLVVRYDGYAFVECSACGETVMWNEFPPAGLAGRTPREVAVAFDAWTRHRFHLAVEGVCPSCAGEMTTEVVADPPVSTDHRCTNCKYAARVPLVGHLTRHPAVVSFYHDRGVDVEGMPYWDLRGLEDDLETTVRTDDPVTVHVTIESAGERLGLTLDERLQVTAVEGPRA